MPKSATLARRHRQSAIVSELVVSIVQGMQRAQRYKNIGRMVEHYMVAMAIRLNDDAGRDPATIATLAKFLNIPRTNVRRAADALVRSGIVLRREDGRYIGNLEYLAERIDAPYFRDVTAAILKAADDLRKTGLVIVVLQLLL